MNKTIYNTILTGTFICTSPYLIFATLFNLHGMRQRMGIGIKKLSSKKRQPFWFHAASMGEVIVLAPFIKELKKDFPQTPIILTTATATGQERCHTMIPDADSIMLLPLDIPLIMDRFIKILRPSHLFIAETELWPNMICGVKKQGGNVFLINGKISPRSTKRYLLMGDLLRETIQAIDFFGLQRKNDQKRFLQLGAAPQALHVLGNIKFDLTLFVDLTHIDRTTIRSTLNINKNTPVFIAGSTRPTEEAILLEALQNVYTKYPDLITIIVPRHMKRLKEIEQLLNNQQYTYCRRSQLLPHTTLPQIILVDTMGELLTLYAAADIAFVGGSLIDFGGHNPLEPALFSIPILFGPHMHNNATSASRLLTGEGALSVTNATTISKALIQWLKIPADRIKAGKNAHKVIEVNSGIVKRYINAINATSLLKKQS